MSELAGIWVRVSTDRQDEASQLPDVLGHCAARGYDVAKRYELRDKSAFHGEQEAALAEMLADVRRAYLRLGHLAQRPARASRRACPA